MMSSQSKFKKRAAALLNIFQLAAERVFLASLILIFVSLLLGLAVFYRYNILPQKIEPEIGPGTIKFEEGVYQKILEEWQKRGERFEAAKTKRYPDLFK